MYLGSNLVVGHWQAYPVIQLYSRYLAEKEKKNRTGIRYLAIVQSTLLKVLLINSTTAVPGTTAVAVLL